ncbi:hypothetical protein [Xanthobacter tagetidis]|uniref:hypothetical protein n=1 Tax=Xanthobacter tagetidis TaxID=60216 RepID=UPI0011C433E4|nr:hypothetical protein [Xanthobacter tagetidis]MBB6308050.1 hypothetical protein [Xanthobacter tagetidis]
MGRSGQTRETGDRLARLVTDVLDAAAEARRTLARICAQAEEQTTGGDPAAFSHAAFSRFVEETALAALLLRAAREGDLGADAARREMERLGPCPAGAAQWPAALQADAARLAGLRRALAAQDAEAAADILHAPAQRKEPRRRPSGRPRLRLVESEGR